MKTISSDDIKSFNEILLDKKITKTKAAGIAKRLNEKAISKRLYMTELFLSSEFMKIAKENAPEFHLFFAHHARLKLISSLLPKAKTIVDLGGANGSIYEMGYPFKFEEITVIDLPPKKRNYMYKDLKLKPKITPNGIIKVHFGDMCDLSFIASNSTDMVWSGQSIEHIPIEAGVKMINEAFRILKPGGFFCLDTPNRLITEIHTSGFIHPEHKVEYYPEQLQKTLRQCGFKIIDKRGVRDMPNTYKTKTFDYSDYILGNSLPINIESAYIQYYCCQKPIPTKKRDIVRKGASRIKQKVNKILNS